MSAGTIQTYNAVCPPTRNAWHAHIKNGFQQTISTSRCLSISIFMVRRSFQRIIRVISAFTRRKWHARLFTKPGGRCHNNYQYKGLAWATVAKQDWGVRLSQFWSSDWAVTQSGVWRTFVDIVLCPKLAEIIKIKFNWIHWYPPPRKGKRQLYKTLVFTRLNICL